MQHVFIIGAICSIMGLGLMLFAMVHKPASTLTHPDPPSAEALAIIAEIEEGPDDWEIADHNGYFSKYYSPERAMIIIARPSMEPGQSEEYEIAVGRMERVVDDRWWIHGSWFFANPVGPPDSRHILRAAAPHLRQATPVIKTYPNKLGPVVAQRGQLPLAQP